MGWVTFTRSFTPNPGHFYSSEISNGVVQEKKNGLIGPDALKKVREKQRKAQEQVQRELEERREREKEEREQEERRSASDRYRM